MRKTGNSLMGNQQTVNLQPKGPSVEKDSYKIST